MLIWFDVLAGICFYKLFANNDFPRCTSKQITVLVQNIQTRDAIEQGGPGAEPAGLKPNKINNFFASSGGNEYFRPSFGPAKVNSNASLIQINKNLIIQTKVSTSALIRTQCKWIEQLTRNAQEVYVHKD